jgi:hypothetical protein
MHDTSFNMAGPKRLRLRLIQQIYLLWAREEICADMTRTNENRQSKQEQNKDQTVT